MTRGRTGWIALLGTVAVMAAAFNLRPAVVSIGPLLEDIRATTGLSGTGAGLLGGLSVVCFGAFAPFARRLSRRFGAEHVLLTCVALLVPLLAARLIGGIPVLFVTVLLCGAAIAVANVLVPTVIHSGPARHVGMLMGIYVVALNGSAALAALIAVPLRDAFDGSWPASLAFWALPAAIATVIGLFAWRGRVTRPADPGPRLRLERATVTWALPLMMACQVAQFYGATVWLPTVFQDAGASPTHAGALLSLMQFVGVATGLAVPILAARARQQSGLALFGAVLWAGGWIGVIAAPMAAPVLWMVLMGLGQGAGISIALTLIVLRATDGETSTALSARTHRDGYLFGALGPLMIGIIHAATGEWRVPLVVLALVAVPMAISGWLAGRPGKIGSVPA